MRSLYAIITFFIASLALPSAIQAQTPSDAIMMMQRESCFGLIYEGSSFDEYWEGTRLRTNGTIATIHRNSVNPMIAIGVHDRLNLLVGAPWVKTHSTEPNGGYFEGADGFQDILIALKGEVVKKEMSGGELAFLTTVAYSTPLTNYLSDYRPYSIGFGADEFTLRGILQYKLHNGLYIRGALAHLWRGETEVERDYYYNNGSFYSATMDVPGAWNYNLVFGKWFWEESLQIEASYDALKSTSGDDIRPYNAAQPTNKTAFDRINVLAHYYFDKPNGLGILAFGGLTLNGRNVGKASLFGVGLTYVFKV